MFEVVVVGSSGGGGSDGWWVVVVVVVVVVMVVAVMQLFSLLSVPRIRHCFLGTTSPAASDAPCSLEE